MTETWPVVQTEQSPHASSWQCHRTEPIGSESAPSGDLPVTPEEEEAWLVKMQQLAGCVA